jgi:Ca2+-binding RTX toxin-like protein
MTVTRIPSRIIQIEAEDMELGSYRVRDNSLASNGESIALLGSQKTGIASMEFLSGSSGLYDIVIGYFDRADGKARLEFQVNGTSIDSWVLDRDLGSRVRNEETFRERKISGVELNRGDTLDILGTANHNDLASVDFIRLIPQGADDLVERPPSSAEPFAPVGGETFNTPILNFDGQGFSDVYPPDTVGDVGIDHYIQMINSPGGADFTIYNKSDGSVALGPITLSSLAPPGSPGQFGLGDPIVLYDNLADRWLLSEFSDPFWAGGNFLNVYISQTNDPTDNLWHYYSFETPEFPDYPKYAVWSDAYYVSTNESNPTVYALDRDNMLLGNPARPLQRFEAPRLAGFPFQALTPSDLDGQAPSVDSSNYYMRHRDDEVHNPGDNDPTQDFLEIWEFNADFDNPDNSTFTQTANIAIAEFDSDLCGLSSFFCFDQPGADTADLDPLREVIMHRLQYRNFGTYETLVGNFVTDVDGTDRGGVRWFELRKSGSNPWTLFQEGTVAYDEDNRWMGAISMDGDGNIALGYNVSSETTFPSLRYTGRLATDPLGTMPQGENVLVDGTGSQTGFAANRWGDYSAMSVDPVDDSTFWFTGEYALANGNWATRIGSFTFASPVELIGTEDDDVLTGTNRPDLISGLGGNDILQGLGGNDSILGGNGDDLIAAGAGQDTVEGGAGSDRISGNGGDDNLLGNQGRDDIFAGDGNDTLNGGNDKDRLLGQAGDDNLVGEKGNDTLDGGEGNDSLNGGTDQDSIFGSSGNDSLFGEAGADSLTGGLGNDSLDGGAGNDRLIGVEPVVAGSGGGFGAGEVDVLTGLSDSDTFVLGDAERVYYDDSDPLTTGESDYALITDFNASQDVIQLKGTAELYSLDFFTSESGTIEAALIYDPGVTARGEVIGILPNVSSDLSIAAPAFTFV